MERRTKGVGEEGRKEGKKGRYGGRWVGYISSGLSKNCTHLSVLDTGRHFHRVLNFQHVSFICLISLNSLYFPSWSFSKVFIHIRIKVTGKYDLSSEDCHFYRRYFSKDGILMVNE